MLEFLLNLILCLFYANFVYALPAAKAQHRIISLSPDITEILFAIGAEEYLVGVISGSDYPPAAKSIPSVGNYAGIDIERILSLKPDLVVTWDKMFARHLKVLKKMGITVYETHPTQLEDIALTMQQLGVLTGLNKSADIAAKNFTQQLNQLREKYDNQKSISVFYQIGSHSLFTINKKSWINQVIELCGGKNIFANVKTTAPEVTWEALIQLNPQVVISDHAINHARWQKWPKLSAVKHQQLFTVEADLIDRAGPRLIGGVEKICSFLEMARKTDYT